MNEQKRKNLENSNKPHDVEVQPSFKPHFQTGDVTSCFCSLTWVQASQVDTERGNFKNVKCAELTLITNKVYYPDVAVISGLISG